MTNLAIAPGEIVYIYTIITQKPDDENKVVQDCIEHIEVFRNLLKTIFSRTCGDIRIEIASVLICSNEVSDDVKRYLEEKRIMYIPINVDYSYIDNIFHPIGNLDNGDYGVYEAYKTYIEIVVKYVLERVDGVDSKGLLKSEIALLDADASRQYEEYTYDELHSIYKNQDSKNTPDDESEPHYAQYNIYSDNGAYGDENCFITTAVCKTFGKPDDCSELTAFRAFRDTYMKENEVLNTEVNNYYEIAPKICAAIDAKGEVAASIAYKWIWDTYLFKAYDALNNNEPKKAYQIYKDMVIKLREIYL